MGVRNVHVHLLPHREVSDTGIGVLVDPTDDEAKYCTGFVCIAVTNDQKLTGLYKYGKRYGHVNINMAI